MNQNDFPKKRCTDCKIEQYLTFFLINRNGERCDSCLKALNPHQDKRKTLAYASFLTQAKMLDPAYSGYGAKKPPMTYIEDIEDDEPKPKRNWNYRPEAKKRKEIYPETDL